jgi:gas vesicle protein
MNGQTTQNHDSRFLIGLVMGGVVGAGLTMLLAPRAAAEIKARAMGSARSLGTTATERYRGVKIQVADAVDGLTRKGQGLRDDACDTVVRGAQTVEHGAQNVQQYAADLKTRTEV